MPGVGGGELESEIQCGCVDLLRLHERMGRLTFFAVPNGSHLSGSNKGVRSRKGRELKDQGMRSGVPDIVILVPDGKAGFAELKTKSGSLSVDQQGWRDTLKAMGFEWRLVRSVEDMAFFIAELGA